MLWFLISTCLLPLVVGSVLISRDDVPCMTGNYTLSCNECGGQGTTLGACKGVDGQYKGCPCTGDLTDTDPYGYTTNTLDPVNWSSIPVFTPESWALDPSYQLSCQNSKLAAPQRSDGPNNVQDMINDFCFMANGSSITRQPYGVDTHFQMFVIRGTPAHAMWVSAQTWSGAPSSNKCGNTAQIRYGECTKALTRAMIMCDPNNGDTHGGSYPGPCIQYNITMDDQVDSISPPWNRQPVSITGDCVYPIPGGKGSGIKANFFSAVALQFCADFSSHPKNQDFTHIYNEMDFPNTTPDYPMSLNGRNWRFNLTFAPYHFSGSQKPCRRNCLDTWNYMIANKCGLQGSDYTEFAPSGSKDEGCGLYSWNIDMHV